MTQSRMLVFQRSLFDIFIRIDSRDSRLISLVFHWAIFMINVNNSKVQLEISRKSLFIFCIFVFFIITRFYNLGLKPLHHDESMFATFAYNLYQGQGYQYQPILHGPFLIDVNAFVYLVLGDSNFTCRLITALFGIGIFILLFNFRKLQRNNFFIYSSVLIAISPTLMYYSRFLRNDVLFAFFSLLCVFSAYKYFRSDKKQHLYFMILSAFLLMCIKENFIIFFFTLITYLYVVNIIEKFRYVQKEECVFNNFIKKPYKDKYDFFIAILIGIIIYVTLYTTFFTNLKGFLDGLFRESFKYWWEQNKLHRLKGPFHYYIPILFIYEFPALLFCTIGMISDILLAKRKKFLRIFIWLIVNIIILYLLSAKFEIKDGSTIEKITHIGSALDLLIALNVFLSGIYITIKKIREKKIFFAFLVYWFVMSLLIYSYAGEKVPWLSVHITLPMILLGAKYLSDFLVSKNYNKFRFIYLVLFLILALYNIKNSIILCFKNADDPAERMVYVHSTKEVPKLAKEIIRLSESIGTGLQTPIHLSGESKWPLYWYLRKFNNLYASINLEQKEPPIIIMDPFMAKEYPDLEKEYFFQTKILRSSWIPPTIYFKDLMHIIIGFIPRQYISEELMKDYVTSIQKWNNIIKYLLLRKEFTEYGENSQAFGNVEFLYCVRRDVMGTNLKLKM